MKRIAAYSVRVLLILGVAALMLAGALPSASAGGEKADICHFDAETGTYHLINVSVHAIEAHINHGDTAPGEPVPSMEGYRFARDCTPLTVCPTYGDFEEYGATHGLFYGVWADGVYQGPGWVNSFQWMMSLYPKPPGTEIFLGGNWDGWTYRCVIG